MKKILLLIALLPLAALADPPGSGTTTGSGCIENCGNEGGGNVNPNAIGGLPTQAQLQGQAQGQLQGQAQGNFNAVDVSNNVRTTASSNSLSGSQSDSASVSASDSASQSASTSSTEQSQTASADNSGNAQTINFNEAVSRTVRSTGTVEVRTVPTAIAPNIYPTASCAMAASAGASALGWGASVGGTKVNHECVMLETARVFSQLGYPSQGLDVMCATKVALDVFGSREGCLAGQRVVEPGVAPSVVVLPAAGVSQEVVTEQIDRAFKAAVSK